MKFVDLFCGIGGFRQALMGDASSCVLSSDCDRHAQHIYHQNYGETPIGDITKVTSADVPKHDILCGGFPCQPFSISGNQYGFKDVRGTLLHEILRIARVAKPAVLFLENVKNYLTHDGGRTMRRTIELIQESGYSVFYEMVDSSGFGVPQKRVRLFFVCFRKDLDINDFSFPEPFNVDVALEDILLPADDPKLSALWIDRNDFRMKAELPVERESKPLRIGTIGKGGQGERVYSTKGHAVTLSAFGGGVGAKTGMYLVDGKIRRLHPEECRKIMGFAEGFKVHPRQNIAFQQFGNSVAVPVVRAIGDRIKSILNHSSRIAA
ncbi:MAG: DNA cytosine methyltransferase [Opitutales bacterium]